MLNKEQNDLITLTNAGTPGGDLMRRYWQPVALSEELTADTPVPTRILGEDLVLFRDPNGRPQLIGRYCPHRSVDLSYGRLDKGGLRCVYHGWLMSGDGRCLEQPGEPASSDYKDRIRQTAYPCHEAGGLILTYMGPGQPPRIPDLPFMSCPPEQTWCTKIFHECNYLQGNEGNVDPQHLSFLHVAFGAQNSLDPNINDLIASDVAPRLDIEETPYGYRIFAVRSVGPEQQLVRITNFIMPNSSAFDGVPLFNPRKDKHQPNLGFQIHWHVPIDDGSHWKYTVLYRYAGAIDKELMSSVFFGELDKGYHSPRNAQNRYLQDRQEMKATTFAGVGRNFYDQDLMAVETQGRIMDRSREHLGTTDRPIILMRRQLLKAVEDVRQGRDPLFVERDGQPNALSDLAVRANMMPKSVDPRSGWWRTVKTGDQRAATPVPAE
jgi:phenylpropionate dioxygenase-like ring-hydroxylating dioxygenase large terminal subunit